MIPVRILGTSSLLPGRRISTTELARGWAGTRRRSRASGHQVPPLDRPGGAAQRAHYGAGGAARGLRWRGWRRGSWRRIIFVSSVSGDVVFPATANRVAAPPAPATRFDMNNACMGFLSAFDVAARSVATGLGRSGSWWQLGWRRAWSCPDPRPYLVSERRWRRRAGPARGPEGLLGTPVDDAPSPRPSS